MGGNPVGSPKDVMRAVLVDINGVAASNFTSPETGYVYRLRIRARVVFDVHYARVAGGGNDIAGKVAGSAWIRHFNMAAVGGGNTPLAVMALMADPYGTLAAWQGLPASNTIP